MDRRALLKAGAAAAAGLGIASARARPADLVGDIEILRTALRLHAGAYRYSSPRQVDAALQALSVSFATADRIETRYLLLSGFLATLRCGHSYANFFNQKKVIAAGLFDRPTRLPFHFRWLGGAMVVTDDPSGTLAPGTQVLRIGDRDAAALLALLMPYVRADGHNDAKRVSLLEVRGDERIETFDVFQGLLAPPPNGIHRLSVRAPGGGERVVEVAAIDLQQRQAQRTVPEVQDDAPAWTWSMLPGDIALLTMPNWALFDSKWNWRAWLDERLDRLSGAKGLIVDLRQNEGGLDCGDPILARMIDHRYVPPRIEQRLRFQRTPASLDPYLDTWDDSFRTLGVGAKPLANGFFLRPGGDEVLAIEPAARRLTVPVAVLTSAVNSSATFHFAQNIRAIGKGRLIGGATGGNRRGINGGCFFFVRLPASGLEFDLPLVGYFPTTPQPDAGLLPDIVVAPGAADIAAGRDVVLDRAVAALRRG